MEYGIIPSICSVILKPLKFAAALSRTAIGPSNRVLCYAASISDVLYSLKVFSGKEIVDALWFWSSIGILSNIRVSVFCAFSNDYAGEFCSSHLLNSFWYFQNTCGSDNLFPNFSLFQMLITSQHASFAFNNGLAEISKYRDWAENCNGICNFFLFRVEGTLVFIFHPSFNKLGVAWYSEPVSFYN